jgi:hypothetical protein
MKYKKFLLIPLLVFIYVFFVVDMLSNYVPVEMAIGGGIDSSGAQTLSVGDAISVYVVRPYMFGMVQLPVYTNYLGDIGGIHSAFFTSMSALTVIFFGIEVWNALRGDSGRSEGTKDPLGYIKEVRDYNNKVKASGRQRELKEESYEEEKIMPEKKGLLSGGLDIKKLLKVLAIAFGIGLVHFFITAMGEAPDGNITWALILLLIYLGYKL